MSKTYAIADMHGRFDLFVTALNAIAGHARNLPYRVIILGDFVDRGPEPKAIVSWMQQLQISSKIKLIVLQGNHEAMMLEALRNPDAKAVRWWTRNGGDSTLGNYGYQRGRSIKSVRVPIYHRTWLEGLPVTYQDEHRIYVHAGVPFDRDISDVSRDTLQWMLYAGDEHCPGAMVLPDEGHQSGKHIVHGHQQSADHPLLKPHRTNLDSWAYHTGRLAIGVFDDAVPGGPVQILWAEGPAA